MIENRLLTYVQTCLPELLDGTKQLVECESPSTDKPALDKIAELLVKRFRSAGGKTELISDQNHGDQVQVFYPSQAGNHLKPALILCHYDTVWPVGTLADRPFTIQDGRARGPGIFDMKASILMVEVALKSIQAVGLGLPRPVTVLLTSDEEIGSPSSRPLIERHAQAAEYVLVMEPPTDNGALKTARKGVGSYKVVVEGRAAHAGTQPEQGISAITELARQVLKLQALNDPQKGTSLNVGLIRGGTRRNVIPARAEAEVDVRAWSLEEAARVEQAILSLQAETPGAVVRVHGEFARPPMERNPQIAALFERARVIGQGIGLDLREGRTGGGSDGNFTAALGLPTLDGLGPIGDGAHADHEYVAIRSLAIRTALLAELLVNL